MDKFFFSLIFGLCLLEISQAQIALNISCRYRGVLHVEKNNRYSLTREEGVELCQFLNCSLATMEQLERALEIGFETCRYGWIEESIVVPRIHPHPICAANNTGVYILISNITQRYDVYCFNASETREKVCDPVILPSSFPFTEDETTDSKDQGPQLVDPLGSGAGTEATHREDSTPSKSDAVTDYEQNSNAIKDAQDTDEPQHFDYDTTTAGRPHIQTDVVHPDGFFEDYTDEPTTEPAFPGATEDEDTVTSIKQHPDSTSTASTTETPYETSEETTKKEEDIVIPPQKEAHPEETQSETDNSKSKGNNGRRSGGLSSDQETTDAPGFKRVSRIPDWLIITVSLICLALILAVCIAVNSRRRCGHKKKLVINGNKGPVEDGRMEEVNGEASKSQEMVHLVHKEHTSDSRDASDGLMSAEQARNQQKVDMKIGV